MLQFAFILFSANALKCNMWATTGGTTSDLPEQDCSALAVVGGFQWDACVSYSFTLNNVVYNAGQCATSKTCDDQKAIGGTVPDFKCSTCKTDNCNTKGGNSGGGDKPAADSGKVFHAEMDGVCVSATTEKECPLASINSGGATMNVGGCPAAYTAECSYKIKHKDGSSNEMPITEDTDDCGKTTMKAHTKGCAACTGRELEDGDTFEGGPTCSNAGALAFGFAALVATLLF